MTARRIIAWDIGGAHLKVAMLKDGKLAAARQYATPLWQGLAALDDAITDLRQIGSAAVCAHVLTMTGELADVFTDRHQGVDAIIERMLDKCAGDMFVYAGPHGFIQAADSSEYYAHIASANWHATASWLAAALDSGYLLDIGTTTTDIVPFAGGRTLHRGYTDFERLRTDELIYTGVVRTPVMAVAHRVPFQGAWQSLAAEHFANMADVYRLTGELAEQYDMLPTTDGAGKTLAESRRRLARMLGADAGQGNTPKDWLALARFLAGRQYAKVAAGFLRVRSRHTPSVADCIIATGAGAFLARRLARRQGCRLYAFENIAQPGKATEKAPEKALYNTNCATAIALAHLFHAHQDRSHLQR